MHDDDILTAIFADDDDAPQFAQNWVFFIKKIRKIKKNPFYFYIFYIFRGL